MIKPLGVANPLARVIPPPPTPRWPKDVTRSSVFVHTPIRDFAFHLLRFAVASVTLLRF